MTTRTNMTVLWLAAGATVAAVIGAGAYHGWVGRERAHREAAHAETRARAEQARKETEAMTQRIERTRRELEVTLRARENAEARATERAGGSARTGATKEAGAVTAKMEPRVEPAELRRQRVESYVSDQRLKFAGLLERVGFGTEQRRNFDAIHAAYQAAMLDGTVDQAGKQAARLTRDAQLRELFGAEFHQWIEANRLEPARAIVDQMVQGTFQSAGAITPAQVAGLTAIVDRNRLPVAGAAGQRYDWDKIVAEARGVLAEGQRGQFGTVVEYLRTTEAMSAMAAKK